MSALQIVGIVVSIGVGVIGFVVGVLRASKMAFELQERRRLKDKPAQNKASTKPAFAVGPPFPREPRRTFWR